MAFKLLLLAASIALARGSGIIGAPAVVAKLSDATIDPNPAYSFAYDVQDTLTGDSKSQVESRANGVVKGQYTVADPDGTRRIVDYYADPIHGFNAVVRKTPLAVAAPVVARAVAAPVVAPAAPLVAPAAPLVARSPVAPIVAPAPYAAAAPVVAPGLARLASPYAFGGAPLAVAPGVAGVAPAPLAVAPGFSRVAAPLLAPPAHLARIASPYSYVL